MVGELVEAPTGVVLFESDPDATAPPGVAFDDLEALGSAAEEEYRAAIRRAGIAPWLDDDD